jgi:hypothetical protein
LTKSVAVAICVMNGPKSFLHKGGWQLQQILTVAAPNGLAVIYRGDAGKEVFGR